MLTHLQVTDFTLVSHLSLDINRGLTVLTGETGAGKSVLLNALGLATGDRADADRVRQGAGKAEVCAAFEIEGYSGVREWLSEAELGYDECVIRRVVTAEGRSRAYINGQLVTLTQLRHLGKMLVDMHSQHEHQSLLNSHTHIKLLDAYGGLSKSASDVKKAHSNWLGFKQKIDAVSKSQEELNARYQLLSYQLEEMEQLELKLGECEQLEARQKKLLHATEILQACQRVSDICYLSEGSVEDLLNKSLHLIGALPLKTDRLQEVESMLKSALIQVEEATSELQKDMDSSPEDDQDLVEIERRLTQIYDISRKHRVSPNELYQLQESLSQEFSQLKSGDAQLEELRAQLTAAERSYQTLANQLSTARLKAASELSSAVNHQLNSLAMSQARFEIAVDELSSPSAQGNESVEFLISTVPSQPPKALSKVASGGELSRVSLAIQVVTAESSVTPTIVFDEVDVGIGGETGDVVGHMLRTLGQSAQVLCVTHLAQVASKAHHHMKVEKNFTEQSANTHFSSIQGEEKVSEIARMMGGAIESEQSRAHAREMLSLQTA